jgi:hypothetical protein
VNNGARRPKKMSSNGMSIVAGKTVARKIVAIKMVG